jgi:hypothetical protein
VLPGSGPHGHDGALASREARLQVVAAAKPYAPCQLEDLRIARPLGTEVLTADPAFPRRNGEDVLDVVGPQRIAVDHRDRTMCEFHVDLDDIRGSDAVLFLEGEEGVDR